MVECFITQGAKVIDTAWIGRGFPDLLVCINNHIYFVEIKNPNTAYGRKGLNDDQLLFEKRVKEKVYVVRNEADVIYVCHLN